MKFSDLKSEAKQQLVHHYGFLLMLLVPTYLFGIICSGALFVYIYTSFHNVIIGNFSNITQNSNQLSSITFYINNALLLSAMFVMIKVMRGQETEFTGGFKKALNIFTRGDYFFGAFVVGVVKYAYMFAWTILSLIVTIITYSAAVKFGGNNSTIFITIVIIMALVSIACTAFVTAKGIAYSQAQYIFRDSLDAENPVGYNQAVTISRKLMNGHKLEFFLLVLSFIPWYLLSYITAGIAGIFFVTPYTKLTYANYYVKLSQSAK